MEKQEILNDSELLTLLATLRLGDQAYGVSLCQELATMTGKPAPLATVYKTLERLEQRHFITSRMGEPSAERGGRAKRFVQVTPQGLHAIDATRSMLNSLWQDVPSFGHAIKKESA